jgi:hypothetical protein
VVGLRRIVAAVLRGYPRPPSDRPRELRDALTGLTTTRTPAHVLQAAPNPTLAALLRRLRAA